MNPSPSKSLSMIMIADALNSLNVILTAQDHRRLVVFTKEVAVRTALVKKLRKAVETFRLDPISLLDVKGIGKMTLVTIKRLSEELQAQEVKREFGVADNLKAVNTILNASKRGISKEAATLIEDANKLITKARCLLENDQMENTIKRAIKERTLKK